LHNGSVSEVKNLVEIGWGDLVLRWEFHILSLDEAMEVEVRTVKGGLHGIVEMEDEEKGGVEPYYLCMV
jgi:hypothetical protein